MAEKRKEGGKKQTKLELLSIIVNFDSLRIMILVKESNLISDLIKEIENTYTKLCNTEVVIQTIKNSVNAILPNWYPVSPLIKNGDELYAFTGAPAEVVNSPKYLDFQFSKNALHDVKSCCSSMKNDDSGFSSHMDKRRSGRKANRHLQQQQQQQQQLQKSPEGETRSQEQVLGSSVEDNMSKLSEEFSFKEQPHDLFLTGESSCPKGTADKKEKKVPGSKRHVAGETSGIFAVLEVKRKKIEKAKKPKKNVTSTTEDEHDIEGYLGEFEDIVEGTVNGAGSGNKSSDANKKKSKKWKKKLNKKSPDSHKKIKELPDEQWKSSGNENVDKKHKKNLFKDNDKQKDAHVKERNVSEQIDEGLLSNVEHSIKHTKKPIANIDKADKSKTTKQTLSKVNGKSEGTKRPANDSSSDKDSLSNLEHSVKHAKKPNIVNIDKTGKSKTTKQTPSKVNVKSEGTKRPAKDSLSSESETISSWESDDSIKEIKEADGKGNTTLKSGVQGKKSTDQKPQSNSKTRPLNRFSSLEAEDSAPGTKGIGEGNKDRSDNEGKDNTRVPLGQGSESFHVLKTEDYSDDENEQTFEMTNENSGYITGKNFQVKPEKSETRVGRERDGESEERMETDFEEKKSKKEENSKVVTKQELECEYEDVKNETVHGEPTGENVEENQKNETKEDKNYESSEISSLSSGETYLKFLTIPKPPAPQRKMNEIISFKTDEYISDVLTEDQESLSSDYESSWSSVGDEPKKTNKDKSGKTKKSNNDVGKVTKNESTAKQKAKTGGKSKDNKNNTSLSQHSEKRNETSLGQQNKNTKTPQRPPKKTGTSLGKSEEINDKINSGKSKKLSSHVSAGIDESKNESVSEESSDEDSSASEKRPFTQNPMKNAKKSKDDINNTSHSGKHQQSPGQENKNIKTPQRTPKRPGASQETTEGINEERRNTGKEKKSLSQVSARISKSRKESFSEESSNEGSSTIDKPFTQASNKNMKNVEKNEVDNSEQQSKYTRATQRTPKSLSQCSAGIDKNKNESDSEGSSNDSSTSEKRPFTQAPVRTKVAEPEDEYNKAKEVGETWTTRLRKAADKTSQQEAPKTPRKGSKESVLPQTQAPKTPRKGPKEPPLPPKSQAPKTPKKDPKEPPLPPTSQPPKTPRKVPKEPPLPPKSQPPKTPQKDPKEPPLLPTSQPSKTPRKDSKELPLPPKSQPPKTPRKGPKESQLPPQSQPPKTPRKGPNEPPLFPELPTIHRSQKAVGKVASWLLANDVSGIAEDTDVDQSAPMTRSQALKRRKNKKGKAGEHSQVNEGKPDPNGETTATATTTAKMATAKGGKEDKPADISPMASKKEDVVEKRKLHEVAEPADDEPKSKRSRRRRGRKQSKKATENNVLKEVTDNSMTDQTQEEAKIPQLSQDSVSSIKRKQTPLSLPKTSRGLSALFSDEDKKLKDLPAKTKPKKQPWFLQSSTPTGFLTPSKSTDRKGGETRSTGTGKQRTKRVTSSQQSRTTELTDKEQELLFSGGLNLDTLLNDESIKW